MFVLSRKNIIDVIDDRGLVLQSPADRSDLPWCTAKTPDLNDLAVRHGAVFAAQSVNRNCRNAIE